MCARGCVCVCVLVVVVLVVVVVGWASAVHLRLLETERTVSCG